MLFPRFYAECIRARLAIAQAPLITDCIPSRAQVTHTFSSACSVSGRIRNHTHHRTMALANVLLLSQIAGHVVALILSLCIFVPLSLHLDHFKYAYSID